DAGDPPADDDDAGVLARRSARAVDQDAGVDVDRLRGRRAAASGWGGRRGRRGRGRGGCPGRRGGQKHRRRDGERRGAEGRSKTADQDYAFFFRLETYATSASRSSADRLE